MKKLEVIFSPLKFGSLGNVIEYCRNVLLSPFIYNMNKLTENSLSRPIIT